MIIHSVATDPGGLVAAAFTTFQAYLTDNAPALLGIGIVAFAIPFVFKWAKHLVS